MARTNKPTRPRLKPAAPEMRQICGLLAQEMLRWPDVHARAMFGMRAFYREDTIFAMLPDTRAVETPWSIAYKLPETASKWRLLDLSDGSSIDVALVHLDRAYRKAVI